MADGFCFVRFQLNPSSNKTQLHSTTRWEQPAKPYLKQDLERMCPKADVRKMMFQKCTAPSGTTEEVLLVANPDDARIILFAEVSSDLLDHKLIGAQQLRSAQGQEHWTAVQQEVHGQSRPELNSQNRLVHCRRGNNVLKFNFERRIRIAFWAVSYSYSRLRQFCRNMGPIVGRRSLIF